MNKSTVQKITMIISAFAAITAIAALVLSIVALAGRKCDKKRMQAMSYGFDDSDFLVDNDDYYEDDNSLGGEELSF